MKLSTNLPPDSYDYQVQFYYDLLDDTYADWSNDYDEDDKRSIVSTSTYVNDDANKLTPQIRKLMEDKRTHPLSMMVRRIYEPKNKFLGRGCSLGHYNGH